MPEDTVYLPEEILDQLRKGIRAAEEDETRWTAEEVRADAKKAAAQWRKSHQDPKSA